MDIKRLKQIAVLAAEKSSAFLRKAFEDRNFETNTKVDGSYVTNIDTASEEIIVDILKKETPDFAIVAEESGIKETQSEYTWIIDPLDGTSNFVHGFSLFANQIALAHNGKIILGVIALPLEELVLSAVAGKGATVNDKPLRIPTVELPHNMILFESFYGQMDFAIMEKLKAVGTKMRVINSACTSLAYVALGRVNGVISLEDHVWDVAAGSLIITEAGGVVTHPSGKPLDLNQPAIIAGAPQLHDHLKNIVSPIYEAHTAQ